MTSAVGSVPVYPLILHQEGDWTPAPVMYFTREFILEVQARGISGCGWGYRLHDGRPMLVYDDPQDDPLLPPRQPKGHRVWVLFPTSWVTYEHSDDVDQVIRGVWPD